MNSRKLFVLFIIVTFFTNNTCYAVYTFGECNKLEEDSLRDEFNRICQQVFSYEINNIDIEQLINSKWVTIGMDYKIDHEIDNAVDRVRKESDFIEKVWSSWSSDKAKEFAEKIANYAFGSEGFKSSLDRLSSEISEELVERFESISAQSASAALMCLEKFIGSRYSESIYRIFEEEVKKGARGIEWGEKIPLDQLSVPGMHKKALGGLGVIIAAQIGKRIAQKIGKSIAQRIAGRIASRIAGRIAGSSIPIVGWIIGGGMIVWDLWDSRQGALPQIQKDLKGEEVKEKIRNEISIAVREQLSREGPHIGREVSNDVYSLWSDFRNKFKHVLQLSEECPELKRILDNTSKGDFYKLSDLVTLILKNVGKDELIGSIRNGSFDDVMSLPEISFQIIETTKSLNVLLAWSKLAGNLIAKVAEYEIYKQKTPEDFDKRLLEKLIDVNDKNAISKLTLLDKTSMEAMLTLTTENLKTISANRGLDDLKCISWYIPQTDQNCKTVIISHSLSNPSVLKRLCDESVKEQIMIASDKCELINFLSSPNDYKSLLKDGIKIITGGIPLGIFFHKYNVSQVIIMVIILLIIVFSVALFALKFIRRQPQIIINVSENKRLGGSKD